MCAEETALFERCRTILLQGEEPRVWSVIATIFGDLAREPGDIISGAVLSQLTGLMGIKPEAMRVALHRLRKDGWIESEKQGRRSVHRLSRSAFEESRQASTRIYGPGTAHSDPWHVVITGNNAAARQRILALDGALSLSADAILTSALPAETGDLLVLDCTAVNFPDWVRRQFVPQDLEASLFALLDTLDRLSKEPLRDLTDPAEKTVLRLLLIHQWRRLILRVGEVPPGMFPPDWIVEQCRTRVAAFLNVLARPVIAELSDVSGATLAHSRSESV